MLTPADVEPHLRACWDAATCDPVDLPWSPQTPSRGQCGVTALVLHDLLGGSLLVAEVTLPDGSRQGWHTWNELPDGTRVDLTREQFAPTERVGEPRAQVRPDGPPGRCAGQYALLRARVMARLAGQDCCSGHQCAVRPATSAVCTAAPQDRQASLL